MIIDTTTATNADFTKISIEHWLYCKFSFNLFLDTGDANTRGTNWINYDLRSLQNQLDVPNFSDTNMTLFFGGLTDPTPIDNIDSGDIFSSRIYSN